MKPHQRPQPYNKQGRRRYILDFKYIIHELREGRYTNPFPKGRPLPFKDWTSERYIVSIIASLYVKWPRARNRDLIKKLQYIFFNKKSLKKTPYIGHLVRSYHKERLLAYYNRYNHYKHPHGVNNLTNIILSQSQIRLLAKGLKYIPSSTQDALTNAKELVQFMRSIKIRNLFMNKADKGNQIPLKLVIRNKNWKPEAQKIDKILDNFVKDVIPSVVQRIRRPQENLKTSH